MKRQLKFKINGRIILAPMYRYIVRSSVLQISGFEFDAAILLSTEWEDYMGGNWKRLRTKDLIGALTYAERIESVKHTFEEE